MEKGEKMKIGFLSAILPEYSFEQVIDFASQNGFESVEAACWPFGGSDRRYAGVTHIDMAKLDDRQAAEILDRLAQRKIEISGIGYYPNPFTHCSRAGSTSHTAVSSAPSTLPEAR